MPITHEIKKPGGLTRTQLDEAYLKLDQSGTPQTVQNGRPIFDGGTYNNDDIILKAGKKLIFDGE